MKPFEDFLLLEKLRDKRNNLFNYILFFTGPLSALLLCGFLYSATEDVKDHHNRKAEDLAKEKVGLETLLKNCESKPVEKCNLYKDQIAELNNKISIHEDEVKDLQVKIDTYYGRVKRKDKEIEGLKKDLAKCPKSSNNNSENCSEMKENISTFKICINKAKNLSDKETLDNTSPQEKAIQKCIIQFLGN